MFCFSKKNVLFGGEKIEKRGVIDIIYFVCLVEKI